MRTPNMDDLSAGMGSRDEEPEAKDRVSSLINALPDRLGEAYVVVTRLNKIGREKQMAHYDKNTKTFSEGDYVYLKEMKVGVGKTKSS